MPRAFPNYTCYVEEVENFRNLSPLISQEQESFFTNNYDEHTMATDRMFTSSSIGSSSMDTDESMLFNPEITNIFQKNTIRKNTEIVDLPEIRIVVQPVDKFRFRYKSETTGTHGTLFGEREGRVYKREVPTAQLINCPFKKAVIRCTLVTADEDRRFPHAHYLVRKERNLDKDDPHDIEVSDANNYTAMFYRMGIIHTGKKQIKERILWKKKLELLEEKKRYNIHNAIITTGEDSEIKIEAEKAAKWMNLNTVALCFQGFYYGENNILHPLTDKIFSRPINNLKCTLTGELKICRIDKHTCCCEGNEEVWLLVEKVGKKNIRVKFYEVDETGNVIWEADGRFSELDVHHQYAIVFKAPPYKDINITQPKEVFLKLERPSDGEVSNSVKFIYKPSNKVLNRKRPRYSSSPEGSELINCVTQESNINLENCTPMAETFMDITNLAGELKNLLSEDNTYDSEELRKLLDDSTLDEYLNLLAMTTTSSNFAVDGDTEEFTRSQQDFAKDTVRKVLLIFKESKLTDGSKKNLIKKTKELLQEFTNYGDTPLHFSLRHEQYDIVQYILVILGTDPEFQYITNMQNCSGKTPLHLAVLQNRADIVRALLKLGADPNICDEDDANSLHNAVIGGADDCIDELLKSSSKINIEAHTESGWSALHIAAKNGSLQTIKALIQAGADVNSTDMSYGRTALHIAIDNNHKHIVKHLLSKTKIEVNKKNFGGYTALHSATVKGGKCAEELITMLKTHGADSNIPINNITKHEKQMQLKSATPARPIIKTENRDSDNEDFHSAKPSFNLPRRDPKNTDKSKEPEKVQLNVKVEPEDEGMSEEGNFIQPSDNQKENILHEHSIPKQEQAIYFGENLEKLTDEHIERLKPILDRTGYWEKLAQYTNNSSLIRLHKKKSSPSAALFNKIKLRQPDITVQQMKKLLIDVQAYEAASALEKS